MSHRKPHDNQPKANQNWIKEANLTSWKLSAKQILENVKETRSKFDEVTIPDPTRLDAGFVN